jgi:hypothetical protein
MEEASVELLLGADLEHPSEMDLAGLGSACQVLRALRASRTRPLFDERRVVGRVVPVDGGFELESAQGRARLAGELGELASFAGRDVVAFGHAPSEGRFELRRVHEFKARTLELFTMTHCPYGRAAEKALLTHLSATAPNAESPRVEIRYILYEREGTDGARHIEALHGEDEIQETLVQLVVRDTYPWLHHEYVLQRCDSAEPWEALVRRIGLSDADVELVRTRIHDEREALLRAELDYATRTYGVRDGSPTYVWEGEIAPALNVVPGFGAVRIESPSSCSS